MKKDVKTYVLIAIISGLVYFVTTYPVRELFSVFTVTDVRPGCVVPLFSSICFGPAAAIGCAISNAIADYLVGNSMAVILEGIPIQFLYGYIPYKVWKALTKGDDHSYRIDSASKYLKIMLVSFIFALLSSIGVGTMCYQFFNLNPIDIGKFVLLNNFTFPMLFSYPIMILANLIISGIGKDNLRTTSISEKVMLFSSLLNVFGIIVIALYVYYGAKGTTNYAIWNDIYLKSMGYVDCICLLTLLVLLFIDHKLKESK